MLKNLVFKKPIKNNFTTQSMLVMELLTAGTTLVTVVAVLYLSKYVSLKESAGFGLDLVITFISPGLFSCLELGAQYSRTELLRKRINTTDPVRINTAGEVDMVVFDKTGTLTETGVDILCVDTLSATLSTSDRLGELERLAVSTCHSVMELGEQYSGDVLDMKMFLFSRSRIINRDGRRLIALAAEGTYEPICREEPSETAGDCMMFFNATGTDAVPRGRIIEVVRTYDFDAFLKRMSVVVRMESGREYLFCKGAPDALARIIDTLPPGYTERVNEYGLQGHRTITLAYRELTAPAGREADERGLAFLGFVVFANRLKGEATGVIGGLRAAKISTRMCTGDSILTAISVARECGMLERKMPVLFPVIDDAPGTSRDAEWFCVADEDYIFDRVNLALYSEYDRGTPIDFAVACEGREYEHFRGMPQQRLILERGVVFARFNPENKKCLVEDSAVLGMTIMYCGDGANDTGALAAADVGLALATNEASLAASFNSCDLHAVLDLVCAGRSALAMSAAQFKYLLYSQILAGIQMIVLLFFLCFPSDMMSLLCDIMGIYALGYALCNFRAATKIHPHKPCINLSRDSALILAELFLVSIVFIVSLLLLGPAEHKDCIMKKSEHSTVIFIIIYMLLIYKAVALADCGPHRQSVRSNHRFITIAALFLLLGIGIFAGLLFRLKWLLWLFEFVVLPKKSIGILAACFLFTFIICFVFSYLERIKNEPEAAVGSSH